MNCERTVFFDFLVTQYVLKVDISHNLIAIDSANNMCSAASLSSHSADCCDHTDLTCWNSVRVSLSSMYLKLSHTRTFGTANLVPWVHELK